MANTGTAVIEWVALVRESASRVVAAGGDCSPSSQQAVLIDGLLPEFKPLIHSLNYDNLDNFEEVVRRVYSFADENNIRELTSGGKRTKNHTFVQQKAKRVCRFWTKHKCWNGDRCRMLHEGPGGTSSRPDDDKPDNKTGTSKTLVAVEKKLAEIDTRLQEISKPCHPCSPVREQPTSGGN